MPLDDRPHSHPAEYLEELKAKLEENAEDIDTMQALAESYFEMGAAEAAKPLIERAIELDPEGEKGAAKYFWLGQLLGGTHGLDLYVKGVTILQRAMVAAQNNASLRVNIGLQLSQAYLGMIEVWMTDLCMEPEAEQQCERLIAEAFLVCDVDPEAWSVLGSIRISQLQNESAKEALVKAWQLYSKSIDAEVVDHNIVPRLIRLAQSMMELRMLEQVLEVTGALYRLDDQVADLYYLNALCHQALVGEATNPLERSKHIVAAHDAAKMLADLPDLEDDPVAQELREAAETITNSLPSPEIENPFEEEDTVISIPLEDAEEIAGILAPRDPPQPNSAATTVQSGQTE